MSLILGGCVDFGLCSVFKSSGSQKTKKSHGICGSAPYIAPEEWLREPYDPQKVDIWSCGIIYITLKFHGFPWEIAAKSDPHYDAYLKALKMNSIYCIFTKFEDHRCRDVIMQMLNPDPVKRPTVQQILDSEWMMGIDVCTDCQASNNSTHKHFI
jgi:protein-serine/threonine kinase